MDVSRGLSEFAHVLRHSGRKYNDDDNDSHTNADKNNNGKTIMNIKQNHIE